MLTTWPREMKRPIHTFARMAMFVSAWTCGDLGTQKDFITTNMKNKSRMTAVMSSAGFHSKTGVLEMLVSFAQKGTVETLDNGHME